MDGVHARRRREPAARVLLRTHTSPGADPGDAAHRRAARPDHLPGRVYRSDSDLTHTPMFHQVEGLCVDKGVTFAELKGTLDAFVHAFFGGGHADALPPQLLPVHRALRGGGRLLLDLRRDRQEGRPRCGTCKETGWLEVLGAGMVHPKVFENGGIDPKRSPASRSAWASSAWRCCATASTTCGSTSRTTCASSSSSDAAPPCASRSSGSSEYVTLPRADEVARRLTAVGLEVEAIERTGHGLAGVVVARIIASEKHPNAEKLSVTRVDAGKGEPLQVVCGAKNYQVGDMVPLATVGTDAARRHEDREGEAARRRVVRDALLGARARALPRTRAGSSSSTATSSPGRPSRRRSGSRTCSSR